MPSSIDDSSDTDVLPEDTVSDSSHHQHQHHTRSSPSSTPDWSGDEDDYSSDSIVPEDYNFHFEYLNEKQKVLSRAALFMSREDEFAAFTARTTKYEPDDTSPLWEEAKDILAIMDRGEKGTTAAASPILPMTTKSSTTTTTTATPKFKRSPLFLLPTSKRHRIDLSVVNHILASSLLDDSTITTHPTALSCDQNFVSTVLVDGHWMAKALKKYHKPVPSTTTNSPMLSLTSSSWGIQTDPFGRGDMVLLNPDIAATDVMSMEESLVFTAMPQILVTPTPPFTVVHANKAFLIFSGLESHDVIGHASESLLHHVQPVQGTTTTTSGLVGWMTQRSTMPPLPCHVRVVPIVDRSSKTASMTHILLQVQQVEHVLANAMLAVATTTTTTASIKVDPSNSNLNHNNKGMPPTSTNHQGHAILGMIG